MGAQLPTEVTPSTSIGNTPMQEVTKNIETDNVRRSAIYILSGVGIYALSTIVPYIAALFNTGDNSTTHTIYFFVNILTTILPLIGYTMIGWGIALFLLPFLSLRKGTLRQNSIASEDIEAIKARVRAEPEKVEPLWDLGRANLQQYFNRNLSQISYIFWFSVGVMIVGFLLIGIGITESFSAVAKEASNVSSNTYAPAVVGSLAGIITEFIGATFLFIYRSTVQQASEYIKALEHINSVGMAMKILDTISADSKELQDETKAEIVKQLLPRNT